MEEKREFSMLRPEAFKPRAPYYGTAVPIARTRSEIEGLVRKYQALACEDVPPYMAGKYLNVIFVEMEATWDLMFHWPTQQGRTRPRANEMGQSPKRCAAQGGREMQVRRLQAEPDNPAPHLLLAQKQP